jgi:hypothetical protein
MIYGTKSASVMISFHDLYCKDKPVDEKGFFSERMKKLFELMDKNSDTRNDE